MGDNLYLSPYSLLSNKAIKRYREVGEIIIEPYDERNVNPNSYDVTLGEYFFREQDVPDECVSNTYNMYSETNVKRVWGEPQKAKPYSYYKEQGVDLENIKDDDLIIFINPGETILCHTREFIGGVSHVTTMMKARSSLGRNFVELCKDAGSGDVGYFNKWTMEITNNSRHWKIPLIIGRRIAQIVFFDTEGLESKSYNLTGKYQKGTTLDEVQKNWTPCQMLPTMYNDWDNLKD